MSIPIGHKSSIAIKDNIITLLDVQCKSNILVMDNIITLCLRDIILDYIITLCLLDIIIKKTIITMFVGYNHRKTEPHFVCWI